MLTWNDEPLPVWNSDKRRIVGEAEPGVFDTRYLDLADGSLVPGEWWSVRRDGVVVGYGWMDVNWGDAEILLATDRPHRGSGVGTFILTQLDREARARGLNYLCNVVRSTHPAGRQVSGWLERRGFEAVDDGRLVRPVRLPARVALGATLRQLSA